MYNIAFSFTLFSSLLIINTDADLEQLKKIYIKMELMDEQDIQYLMPSKKNIHWKILIERYFKYNNYPKSYELNYLPVGWVAEKNIEFNRAYVKYLYTQKDFYPINSKELIYLNRLIKINEYYGEIWELIYSIRHYNLSVLSKREFIKQYKEKVGDYFYYNRIVPQFITVEVFEKIK